MTDNTNTEFESKMSDVLGEIREIHSKVEKSSASFAAKEEMSKLEEKLNANLDAVEQLRAAMQAPEAKGAEDKAELANKEYGDALNLYMRKGVETGLTEKALSAGSDPDGGYLLTPASNKLIMGRVFETSPVRQYASVQTISTESFDIIDDNDEAASSWSASEQAAVSDSDTPQVRKLNIVAHELVAQPKATQKILDDSAVNLDQWLAGKVSEIFSRSENTAFVSGTGVGQPKGILTDVSGTNKALSAADAYSATLTEVYKSGANGSFGTNDGTAAENLVKFAGKLKSEYAANAIMFGTRATRSQILLLKDGAGNYVFNIKGGEGLAVDGMPFVAFNDMGAFGTTDALALGVADLRRAYQIVDRTGIRVLRDPFTEKPYVKFYTTKRVGGEVVNHEAIKLLRLSA